MKLFTKSGVIHFVNRSSETHFPAWLASGTHQNPPKMQLEKPDQDTHLMAQLASGDESALKFIIERWKQPLIAFFFRSCHNLDDAEDLAQLTFISLDRAAPRYESKAKFSTYLFQIANRKLLNHYRSKKRKPADATAPEDMPQDLIQDANDQKRAEWEEIFEQALSILPINQRSAILLLKQQELSYEEIGEILNASTNAVKTWIHRGRISLKNYINNI